MKSRLEDWIRKIITEVVYNELKHRKHPDNQMGDLVNLMLDLHDKTWSFKSDRFLRVLNIDPKKYWDRYPKGRIR